MALTVRRVGEEDYGGVVAMRDGIYYGTDYIPDTYLKLVKHPAYKGYVAMDNNKFAAFVFTLIVDDGLTLVSRASRVREEYEGKGIYKRFDDQVKPMSVGNAKVHAMTFHEENVALLRQMDNGQAKPIMQRDVLHFMVPGNETLTLPNSTTDTVRKVAALDLQTIFSRPDVSKTLFPEERVVCHWIPFRTIEANIPLILFHSTTLIGSFNPSCTLLTSSHPVKAKLGLACHVTIYGSNFDDLKEHLCNHIRQCHAMAEGSDIHLWVHVANECDIDVVDTMNGFGFKQQFSFPMEKFFCVEKTLC